MKKILFLFAIVIFSLPKLWAQNNNSTPFITKWKGGDINYQAEGALSFSLFDSSTNLLVISDSSSIFHINITTASGLIDSNSTYYLHINFNDTASNRRFYNNYSDSYLINLREVVQWVIPNGLL
jgi:hypothetical protein